MGGQEDRPQRGVPRGAARRVVVAVGASLLILHASCTVEHRYTVLSFFFDGVPEPGAARAVMEQGPAGTAAPSPAAPRPLVFHRPFRDNQCSRCHPRERLRIPRGGREPGFCFGCHEHERHERQFASYRFLHGPAAVESCLDCHHPHKSPEAHLLVAPESELCHRCHDPEDLLSTPAHHEQQTGSCTACHDPHGGSREFFLKEEREP